MTAADRHAKAEGAGRDHDAAQDHDAIQAAAVVNDHLETIRRVLRESIWAEARRYPVPLTPPQIAALEVLVDHTRETGGGLSVSELSTRMGLAHSTVSGIAARLERHGLLSRTAQPDDRRYTRLELTEPVRDWLDRNLPAARLGPLVDAMRNATDEERSAILDGLAALRRLLPESRRDS